MKLVEIIPAVQTSKETLERAKAIIDSWQKLTVLTKDTPGFIVNRVARPFYGEALRILEEGLADIATIDWAMTELGGFRMGPFTLMDYIGNDINYTVTETVFSSFYYDPRYKPAFTQKRLAEAGYLGRKSGRGHYNYAEGALQPLPNKDENLGRMIFDRILVMLINEAADALFWQIASRDDIDTAMMNGTNYPKGLLKWADEIGISACVIRMDSLYELYREDRYRCSPLLRKMANEGKSFF
jgi:3-hydroxybutyryl-CoA dehydrogenase